ncbi:MAG: hypothetical protein LPK06_01845 [Marinobacter sp.]|nr:hypothetical protein [Marinobacter sp.]
MAGVDRDNLIGFLAGIKQGPVEETGELARLLSDVWNDLPGSHDQKTAPYKLISRPLEDVIWSPPLLLFTLERHGGTVNGSSRAELHRWEVDVERWQASILSKGRRQLTKQDKRYNPAPDVEAICTAVRSRANADGLVYRDDGSVKVIVKDIVEARNNQTLAARRRRFRELLQNRMSEIGYVERSQYIFILDDGAKEK